MRKIWFCLLAIGLLMSCGNNEENPSDGGGSQAVSLSPEQMPKSLQNSFKKIVTAFQAKDYAKLDEYVAEEGVYVIYPGPGVYSEYNQYESMTAMAEDESIGEYLQYLTQAMGSGQGLSGKIEFEDLSEADPCEYGEMGYWADVSGGTTVLANTYKVLQENMGEEGDADEYAAIQEIDNAIDYKILVGTGDEADIIYLNEEGGKWYISIVDLSECGF